MKLLCGGLCLITFALVPYCVAQNFFDLRQENESKDPSLGDQNALEAASEQEQSIDDAIDSAITHRQKKSLKLHRPHFFGGGSQHKITANPHPLAKESLQKDTEILNSLHERAAFDERVNEADQNIGQSFIFPPKLLGKQSAHSRVQSSLDDILGSVQKREVGIDPSGIENVESLTGDSYEGSKNRFYDSRGRVGTNLLDAEIRDLAGQISPKSKLIGDKSDLEILHDIIDKNKNSQKLGQSERGNRKIKNCETASFYESMENNDASNSHKVDLHKSGKESSHDTNKEEVAVGTLLDSDLERMIQEAAEKIGQWVNENFDTAKKMKKTQLKGGAVKKQHLPKHANTSDQEMKDVNPLKGAELDEDTKKSALKLFLHAVTADPEAKNSNEGDNDNGLDELPRKRKNKGIRLSVGEVKKIKMTTLPPCFTSTSRHPECAKCLPTVSAKDLDPKLIESLCSKPTVKPPCTQGLTRSTPSTTPNATRKTHSPSTLRAGQPFPTTEMAVRNTALSDKLFKKLVNATFKEAFTDNLVGDKNSNYSNVDLNNLADFLHMLVNAAESVSNNVTHVEFPCGELEGILSNKSEPARVSPKSNLKSEHSAKNSNNKLLNHFVSLAAVDGSMKKSRPPVTQPAEQSDAPMKALSGILDLMRRQSSETFSSHKSLLEDKAVSERFRIQPSENQTVALNVFIKAAIIPDFKNASLKHAAKAAVRVDRAGVLPGRETARPRNADPLLTSPRSQFSDNTLNNLLRSIIVKARFDRQV